MNKRIKKNENKFKNNKIMDDIELDLNVEIINEKSEMLYELGYISELNELRNEIDKIKSEIWKRVRWIINDYDFLVKDPIINRAFYKYWEIINEYSLYDNLNLDENVIIHLAEAPGGFIQVSNYMMGKLHDSIKIQEVKKDPMDFIEIKKEYKRPNILTMSLNKSLPQYKKFNLPSYSESIKNSKVYITYGKDKTGDITNIDNINYMSDYLKKIKKNISLITADGGFDEGIDFNNKEQLHYSLIIHEIITILIFHKNENLNNEFNFVLKIYDIYTITSLHILYLIYNIFDKVDIFKPKTSRPTNSEKYIICQKLKKNNKFIKGSILEKLLKLSSQIKKLKNGEYYFTLFKHIPNEFIQHIKEINNKNINIQCLYLKKALYYAVSNNINIDYKILMEHKENVYKQWLKKYNLMKYIGLSV